uniref:EGF-like domain-containing protein n=1 Tax=Latimeria chalumnae TaxID=7897 RepID=H3ADR2_LATCH
HTQKDFRFFLGMMMILQVIQFGTGCEGQDCEDSEMADSKKQTQKNHSSSLKQFNDLNRRSESRKHRDSGAVLPFIGITDSSRLNKHCCQNGGTCILGSFCVCPKPFIGRHCEYDDRLRNCGGISHGEWVSNGCSWCRCGYGVFHCFQHASQEDC